MEIQDSIYDVLLFCGTKLVLIYRMTQDVLLVSPNVVPHYSTSTNTHTHPICARALPKISLMLLLLMLFLPLFLHNHSRSSPTNLKRKWTAYGDELFIRTSICLFFYQNWIRFDFFVGGGGPSSKKVHHNSLSLSFEIAKKFLSDLSANNNLLRNLIFSKKKYIYI